MATHTSKRIGVLGGLGIGLAGLGLLVGIGFSAPSTDAPDLTAELPTARVGQPNARWIDTVEVPGKVLYRFDTVIFNQGGALDVRRSSESGATCQTIWSGGVPTNNLDQATGACTKDLGANKIAYSFVKGHNHFHTQLAAAYELDTTDGTLVTKAAKNTAGFCLYDSWSNTTGYFVDGQICHPGDPGWTGVVREGISNDMGDFYGSQLGDQWVDVTGIVPGTYMLKAVANPAKLYIESNYDNNTVTDTVTIPGAIAATPPAASTPAGAGVDIPISGTVVGAGELSRKPTCTDDQTLLDSCTTTAQPGKLSFQLSSAPSAGTVQIVDSASDLSAVARYTPPAGFNGVVTFAYTATDSRGLTSRPATVTVTVGSGTSGGGASGGGTTGGGTTGGGAKATVTLKPSFRLVRSGARTFLAVRGTLPRTQAGRLVRIQRKIGKRITTIGVVRVAKTGRFSRTIRVHVGTLSVRASLGSSAHTKAAVSAFRRISG